MDLLSHQTVIRLGCFGGVLLLMSLWEALAPRRPCLVGGPVRWLSNLSLVAVGNVAVRLLVPLTAVAMALLAEERGWGLFNNVAVPGWLAVVLCVVALDLAIYLQHVLFHAVPLLWRLHMVHHADLDFDATTGVRFHPVELVVSAAIKVGAVVLLGAPAVAVLLFEVLLNATSLFNHGNVSLPPWLDRVVRLFVVTPDMHRVHHSALPRETNSNFGFNLPWWDYLFGTYQPQPTEGHDGLTIGLHQCRDAGRADRLPGMLLMPFTGAEGDYPLNRRDDGAAPLAPPAGPRGQRAAPRACP